MEATNSLIILYPQANINGGVHITPGVHISPRYPNCFYYIFDIAQLAKPISRDSCLYNEKLAILVDPYTHITHTDKVSIYIEHEEQLSDN